MVAEWNESNNVYTWSVRVVPGPVTTIAVGSPNYTVGMTYVTSATPFSFSIVDPSGTGIRNTTYRVDGGPWVNYTATGPFALTGEGAHRVEWSSEDFAGNVEPVANETLRVDDTPPTTTVSLGDPKYLAASAYVTSLTPFALASVDGGLLPVGLNGTEYRIDAGPWTPYGGAFSIAGEGTHGLAFRSSDRLGNLEVIAILPVVVDDTPPVLLASLAGPIHFGAVTFVAANTTVEAGATDPGTSPSGVASLSCRIDGGPWIQYVAPFPLAPPDGPKAVECRAADRLGNAATTEFEVVLDATPPLVTADPGAGTYPPDTTFSLNATDAGSGVASLSYRVDGGAWVPYTGPFSLPLGVHTVGYRSVDNVTNAAEGSFAATVLGPSTPAAANWKPLVAAVFAFVLAAVGVWASRRRPWKGATGRKAALFAFLVTSLPFVTVEAATGVASLLTRWLSIPPILGVGTAVDLGILISGIAVLLFRARARTPK